MPQTGLPNLGLNYEFTLGVDDWKNGFDANMVILDSLAQGAFVIDSTLATEPGSPAVGDAYILPAGPFTGTNWGSDSGAVQDSIALFTNVPGQADGSPWLYLVPREGWSVFDRTNNNRLEWDGTEWIVVEFIVFRLLVDELGDYTLSAATDAGAEILVSAAFDEVNDTIFIDSNTNEPFQLGTRIRILNQSGGDLRFTDDAAVTWVDDDPTGWTTGLPDGGFVELVKVGTNLWWVASVHGSGTLVSTLTGLTTTPSITIRFTRTNGSISLSIPSVSGTSNATTLSVTDALRPFLRPAVDQKAVVRVTNSNNDVFGSVQLTTAGVLNFTNGADDTVGQFASVNQKGTLESTVVFQKF